MTLGGSEPDGSFLDHMAASDPPAGGPAAAMAAVSVSFSYRMLTGSGVQEETTELDLTFQGYYSGPHPNDPHFGSFLSHHWIEAKKKQGDKAFMFLSMADPESLRVEPQASIAPGVPAVMKTGIDLTAAAAKTIPHIPVVSMVRDISNPGLGPMVVMTRYWGHPEGEPEIVFIPEIVPVDPKTGEPEIVFYRHKNPKEIISGEDSQERLEAVRGTQLNVKNEALPGAEKPINQG